MTRSLPGIYRNAPQRIRVGRIVMLIGCILMFIAALLDFVNFILAVASPSSVNVNWNDITSAFNATALLPISLFMVFAGIGGLEFIFDKGRLKPWATLGAVIFLFVFLFDIGMAVRTLTIDLQAPDVNAGTAWLHFLANIIDTEITGGLYVIGWFLVKDYMGD